MVRQNNKERKIHRSTASAAAVLLLIAILVLSAGCGRAGGSSGNGSGSGTGRESGSGNGTDKSGQNAGEETENTGRIMYGPETPPDGFTYDEWKGIKYSDETAFDVKSFWGIRFYSKRTAQEEGVTLDDDGAIFGRTEIVEASVKPVGGEMKLRSGGYVDISVTVHWRGSYRYRYASDSYALIDYTLFESVEPEPFDAYTGTALFNSTWEDGSIGVYVGEATDSGLIESDVTWNGRTFRLFAGRDHRNSGGEGSEIEDIGDETVVTINPGTETVYTFRVPADYDGLAFRIPKDIYGEREKTLTETGETIGTEDRYADILTDDEGTTHDVSEFYFVRVTDLLKEERSS